MAININETEIVEEIVEEGPATLEQTEDRPVMEAPVADEPMAAEEAGSGSIAKTLASYVKTALSYTKTAWKNYASGGTALNETNMNNIENGIEQLTTRSNEQDAQIKDLSDAWDSASFTNLRMTSKTASIDSVSADTNKSVNLNLSLADTETCLGIVGWTFSGSSANHLHMRQCAYLYDSSEIQASVWNDHTSALTNLTVRFFYLVGSK